MNCEGYDGRFVQKLLCIKYELVHEKAGFYGYMSQNDVPVHRMRGFYGQESKQESKHEFPDPFPVLVQAQV